MYGTEVKRIVIRFLSAAIVESIMKSDVARERRHPFEAGR